MMRLLPLEEIERLDRGVHWVRWVGDWCVFILPQLQGNVQRLIVIMRKLVVFPIIPIFLFHLKPDLFRDVTFSSELCCFSQELYEYSYFFSQYLISLKKNTLNMFLLVTGFPQFDCSVPDVTSFVFIPFFKLLLDLGS